MNHPSLNIVFMGNPGFAVPAFERLLESNHKISAVVTGTDKRRGRGGDTAPSPVKQAALNASIPVIEADDVSSEDFYNKMRALSPDLFVVVAFKILPARVLSVPTIGSLNLHASLLPKYRGAAPIHHALINGEEETGCTVFLLDAGMDTGVILNKEKTVVDLLETTGDVYDRLKRTGADLLLKTVDELAKGEHTEIKQDDRLATKAPKISPEDARIDFEKDYLTVHNFIRGMSPFPGAWTLCDGNKLKILRTEPAPDKTLPAGEAVLEEGVAYAGCGKGSVMLIEMKPEGRKKVSGPDFLNGRGGNAQFSQR